MVGRHGVAEHGKDAGPDDVAGRRGPGRERIQERRPGDIGRRGVPGVALAVGDGQSSPTFVAFEDHGVRPLEQGGIDGTADDRADLVGRRPHVGEEDRSPVRPDPERFGRQVDIDAAGQRERDHQRRRGEVARARERVDASFEVPVTRQHGRDHQVVGLDGGGDRVIERTGVADACRAAIPGQREPERLQRGHEPGGLEVARSRPWTLEPVTS